jgi:hypothetical protein
LRKSQTKKIMLKDVLEKKEPYVCPIGDDKKFCPILSKVTTEEPTSTEEKKEEKKKASQH